MKRFLRMLLCFCLPALLIVAGLECYVRSLPNSYKYKDWYMTHNGVSITMLVLGSSHAFDGINPGYMAPGVFNAANVAQTPEQDFMILDKYTRFMPNLKTVIVAVGYQTMIDPPMEKTVSGWRTINYNLYYHISQNSRYYFEFQHPFGFSQKIKNGVKGENSECSEFGNALSDLNTVSPENLDVDALKQLEMQTTADREWLDYNILWLGKIADYCHKRGLRLIFVTTPTYNTFNSGRNASQWSLLAEEMERLNREYGAAWLDYSCDNSFKATDFQDATHLSTGSGAIKFSKILAREVCEP